MNSAMLQVDPILPILYPETVRRQNALAVSRGTLAYYTSATTALAILRDGYVWLRNSRVMNDFSEVEYGHKCIDHALSGPAGDHFRSALHGVSPQAVSEIDAKFSSWHPARLFDSYLMCLSEHGGEEFLHEERYGRLSMWRAYGGPTNVCIVLDQGFLGSDLETGAHVMPVLYCDPEEFAGYLTEVANNIRAAKHHFAQDPQAFSDSISAFLHFSALSLKHPGFSEEREWRVILSPAFYPSHRYEASIQVVDGVPQLVYRLNLRCAAGEGEPDISPEKIIKNIIIGPTEYPAVLVDAFTREMASNGFVDSFGRMKLSNIPLRR